MASPQAADKISSQVALTHYWLDGDYTGNIAIGQWVDMLDFGAIMITACGGNLGGAGPIALAILADSASNGASGHNVTIAESTSTACTAEGDYMIVECTAEQIRQEAEDSGYNLRYVCAKLDNGNAGDEVVVTYLRTKPRFPHDGLTVGKST